MPHLIAIIVLAIASSPSVNNQESGFTHICLECDAKEKPHSGCGNCYNNLTCTTHDDLRLIYHHRECYTLTYSCQNNIRCNSTCVNNTCNYKCMQCDSYRIKSHPMSQPELSTGVSLTGLFALFIVFSLFTICVGEVVCLGMFSPDVIVPICFFGILLFMCIT